MDTDEEWEKWANQDPYFSVLTHEKFRSSQLTADTKQQFFDTGAQHVEHVVSQCKRFFKCDFTAMRALDFGCGVARVVIPLATMVDKVVGIDVSASMLQEAQKNCDAAELTNVELLQSDDSLTCLEGEFDFIHSFIVLQHIPTARGLNILQILLGKLSPGGVGCLHVTYQDARIGRRYSNRLQRKVMEQALALWRIARPIISFLGHSGQVKKQQDPDMQMNAYPMSELLFYIQEVIGNGQVHLELTDHGGVYGARIYLQRPANSVAVG